MAASSPALSNNSTVTTNTGATAAGNITTFATAAACNSVRRTDTPPKTQRGLNKPKCKQCGNVARSRCPFECCKSCCSRNQNPCHIHVLKANTTFPGKTPTSSTLPADQQSTEASPSMSASRVASYRQLSNSFSQFNNVHIPLRSKKPLTRKDAVAINEWRFSKLREYKDRNIEMENEAFDRYIQNVSLLEEVLSMKPLMEDDVSSTAESYPTSKENNPEMMMSGLKLQLQSNLMRSDSVRVRIQQVVDQGLKKLQQCESNDGVNEVSDQDEPNKASKKGKNWRSERALAISDIVDKLNKARNEEDLRSCMDMKIKLFNLENLHSSQLESDDAVTRKNESAKSELAQAKDLDYSIPKFTGTTVIDQETLNIIDKHFSSVKIEHL
ncbi:putative Electron carrier/iron ion-binding protein [Quillaja saponaria]|uniref:Electron carrier/iron ion-binding protein n=1 Tax=Quillaja saponaria TaxID=32244 RepID=A0AAD7P759_QUISA|nr:putative Electron carrier/iron ion-binding protein [Quillaja saponaria]KAJ7944651.1 putative Electron carrier/iron ion-binding protein [Quillaja saponaria]